MDRFCGVCKEKILDGETFVTCEGFCPRGCRRFHAECVGLKQDECSVLQHRNVLWLCDDCQDLMTKSKFRNTINHIRVASAASCTTEENEIQHLKSQMEKMNDTLDRLVHAFSSNSSAIPVASCSNDEETPPRTGEDFAPLSSTMLQPIDPSSTANDSSISLHVSNIANDISQTEVIDMVKDSIGASHISSIKLLVPAWKDSSTLDFISFKVDVNVKYRKAALDPSSWPEGVRCREFKKRSTTAWRPINRTQTQ